MVNDSISDTLIQIKNAYAANRQAITIDHSKLKQALVNLLVEKGYLQKFEVKENGTFKQIEVELKYDEKVPALTGVKRVSKPGLRVYTKSGLKKRVFGGLGIRVLSTPQGLMTDKDANVKKMGGEILCEIW